jgi:hypothetical protein
MTGWRRINPSMRQHADGKHSVVLSARGVGLLRGEE